MGTLVALGLLTILLAASGFYHLSRERAHGATVKSLQGQLEQRTTELEEATQTLHRLAGVDSLTNVSNHSHFQEFLRNEWRRALREATSLAVVMIDLDHFGGYNDRLGHQAGDSALAKMGTVLKTVIRRPGDLVARYGGAEFGVVLSRTDEQGAYRVAHKVCAAVEGLDIEHPGSPTARLTVSVGVASVTPAIDSHWEELELVAAAKRALAEAKQSGRNKIVSAADVSA